MEQTPTKAPHVLLIGGVSGVGKSATAAVLARQLGIAWLQVDDLRLALQFSGLISREQHPELFFFLDQNDWRTSPEIYRDKLIKVGRIMTGALQIVVESHIATNVPIILEGDGILPEFAAAIARKYDKGTVRSVFISTDDEGFLLANMLKRGRGIDPRATTEARTIEARAKALYSRWVEHEAQHYGLRTIQPLPWETLSERVLAALTN